MNLPADLRPGDILLYNSGDIADAIIRWKEGDPDTAHVEVYIGDGKSVASRNGIGVKEVYDFRPNGLVHVRRVADDGVAGATPYRLRCKTFDLESAMEWFATVKGAPYGWDDIGADAGLVEAPEDAWTKAEVLVKTGMDCSHFASLFLLAGGHEQFDPAFDARRITPRDFKLSTGSYQIWMALPGNSQSLVTSSPTVERPDLSPRAEGEQIEHTA